VPLIGIENGEHAIHEPLVSPETVAEVPLTALSFDARPPFP
jgi:hypothetical protein